MPRKGENIRKRKDGRWEARYEKCRDQNGRIQYGYLYGRTYEAVKKKKLAVLCQNNLQNSPGKCYVFRNLSEEWMLSMRCGIWHHDRFRPLCEAGINLLLNLLLVNIGGLYGILLSTIISMSFVSLPWLVMNLFNFVFRRSSSEYISILIQNVIVVIVDMIVCYAICQMVHLGGIMTIIFRGAVCVVFSNISYFAIWKNNEDFKDAIKLLNSIFKGKR